jgi:hypothetical protein
MLHILLILEVVRLCPANHKDTAEVCCSQSKRKEYESDESE